MAASKLYLSLFSLGLALTACGGQEAAESSRDLRGVAAPVATHNRSAAPVGDGTAGAPLAEGGVAAAPGSAGAVDGGSAAATQAPAANAGAAVTPSTASPGAGQSPAAESSDDAVEILRKVERAAAGIRSMEADFVQQLSVPLLGTTQESRGKLYQRRPDRFMMRFTEPAGDVMVADGRYFWIYYPSTDKTQVIRTSIGNGTSQVDLQQQFLSNPNARYVATLNRGESVEGRPAHVLTLVPRRASPYKILKIWVDRADFRVRRFEMTEENESVRRIELRNLKVNGSIPDAVFSFTPPAGAQVFDQ